MDPRMRMIGGRYFQGAAALGLLLSISACHVMIEDRYDWWSFCDESGCYECNGEICLVPDASCTESRECLSGRCDGKSGTCVARVVGCTRSDQCEAGFTCQDTKCIKQSGDEKEDGSGASPGTSASDSDSGPGAEDDSGSAITGNDSNGQDGGEGAVVEVAVPQCGGDVCGEGESCVDGKCGRACLTNANCKGTGYGDICGHNGLCATKDAVIRACGLNPE